MKIIKLLGLLLLAANSYAQSNHDNGGDEAERRWNPVRENVKSWIKQGGHLSLKFRDNQTPQSYQQKMLEALEVPVEFIRASDARNLVDVNGLQKMCRNVEVDHKMRLRCIIESVLLIKDYEFINIVHHEYAGIAGFETGSASGASDYYYTNQLSSSIETQITYRLVVKPVLPAGYEKLSLRALDSMRVDSNFNIINNSQDLDSWSKFIETCNQKQVEVANQFSEIEKNDEEKSYVYTTPRYNQTGESLECNLVVIAKTGKYLVRTDSIKSLLPYTSNYISKRMNEKLKPFYLIDQMESGFLFKSKNPVLLGMESTVKKEWYYYEYSYLVTSNSKPTEVSNQYNPNFPQVAQDICRKIATNQKSTLILYKNAMIVPEGILTEYKNQDSVSILSGKYCLIEKTERDLFEVSLNLHRSFKLKDVIRLYVPLSIESTLDDMDSGATFTFDAAGKLVSVSSWTPTRQTHRKRIFNHEMKITVDGKKYHGTYTAPKK